MPSSLTNYLLHLFVVSVATFYLYGCDSYDKQPKKSDAINSTSSSSLLHYSENYKEGIVLAKKLNKPIFLTFTAYASICCRKNYFTNWIKDQRIAQELNENYVVIALFVDDRKTTIESQNSADSIVPLLTNGKKNTLLQEKKFNSSTQPYSIILTTNGEPKTAPLLIESNKYIEELYTYLKENK